jgi:hypothetical protein
MSSGDPYLDALRRMTAEQKLAVAQQLRATAWELKAAGIRAQHPEWPEGEVQAKVREIFLYASG